MKLRDRWLDEAAAVRRADLLEKREFKHKEKRVVQVKGVLPSSQTHSVFTERKV